MDRRPAHALLVFFLWWSTNAIVASPPGDTDGDGVPDASDCHPLDPTVWRIPLEAPQLMVGAAGSSFTWSAPGDPGGAQPVLYDLIRSASRSGFGSATCVASDVTGTSATDPAAPGTAFYYLLRAKNGCGGNLGSASSGTPRTGVSCQKANGAACANAGECAGGGCCGGVCVDLGGDIGSCGACGNSCDDGNACTQHVCGGLASGCKPHVDLNACATPSCALGACALDADGDGLSDAWETNGYIDVDCNGTFDAGVDFAFPHQTPYLFTDVSHTGTGIGRIFPTVNDPTLPVTPSPAAVVVTIATGGTLNTATFTHTVNGGPAQGPLMVRPVVELTGNLRLQFYIGSFVAGDTYTFAASIGADQIVLDKDIPNIFVQYDTMGWDAPGSACTTDADCGGARPNDVCHAGFCNHDHAPGDPLFRKVVDAFAAHNIRLYINPVHAVVPHAQVITWSQQGDGTTGATALCAGYDVVQGNISTGGAVNFHDIKYRPGSTFTLDPFLKGVFHYAVFSHFNSCLTDNPAAPTGNCNQCPTDRATPSGSPAAGGSGLAELPGNDFIVSLANSLNNPLGSVPANPFLVQGVFMHELGHNLGLHHAGDVAAPAGAPNYLSVMNAKYVLSGIQRAAAAGSTISVESLREIDYSEHTLATIAEGQLDEQAGVSPLTSGFTGIVRFLDFSENNGVGPESGPVDWTGDGVIDAFAVAVDLNGVNGAGETMVGYRDWDHTAGPSGAGGGTCVTSADCRINAVRLAIHDLVDTSVDPHEPCLGGACRSLWLNAQCTRWSLADASGATPAPASSRATRDRPRR